MARKRIADKEPAISKEGAAAAPATAGKPALNQAQAPRASAKAVTHRHKKTANTETEAVPTIAELAVTSTGVAAQSPAAKPVAAPVKTVEATRMAPPSREDIAIRAYLLSEARGFQNGSEEQDWLTAERQLMAEWTAR